MENVLKDSEINSNLDMISLLLIEGEEIITNVKIEKGDVTFTTKGIYHTDNQGINKNKVQMKFCPKKSIDSISFVTAGTLDDDVDLYIYTTSKDEIIDVKINKNDKKLIQKIIKIVKENYLC